ncbi:hypothetical protein LP415_13065 [Polaromonas sp. P1(28)-8]|nr:hypothetical protein LP415_13065 [Polaromonas sp. P1(28)-8]
MDILLKPRNLSAGLLIAAVSLFSASSIASPPSTIDERQIFASQLSIAQQDDWGELCWTTPQPWRWRRIPPGLPLRCQQPMSHARLQTKYLLQQNPYPRSLPCSIKKPHAFARQR